MATLLDALRLFETAGLWEWLRDAAAYGGFPPEAGTLCRLPLPPAPRPLLPSAPRPLLLPAPRRHLPLRGRQEREEAPRESEEWRRENEALFLPAWPAEKNALTGRGGRGMMIAEGAVRPKVNVRYVAAYLGRGAAASLFYPATLESISQRQVKGGCHVQLPFLLEWRQRDTAEAVYGGFPPRAGEPPRPLRGHPSNAQLALDTEGNLGAALFPLLGGAPPTGGGAVPPGGGGAAPSPIDYDGIIRHIERRLGEAIACSAEGV